MEHGDNVCAYWSPDSLRVVIAVSISKFMSQPPFDPFAQTSESFLVLISVEHDKDSVAYKMRGGAIPGPGEGLPMQAISLQFEGVIRVDGTLLR